MRHSGLWTIFAVATALFAAGCGGGSGNSSSATESSIWTGASTRTRAAGNSTPMQAEFVFKGTSLTGTVILADPANATVVPVTGTVKGNQLTASGHSVVGTDVTFTGTITSAEITGTYNNNTADTGTFTLTKTTGVTTPTLTKIATDWGGDYITGSTDVPLNLMFTQSGNDLSVHGTTGFGGFGNPGTFFTGNGAIIGNNLAIVFAGPNNVLTYFIGTFNGAVVAGASQDTQGHTGQFRVAPPQ